MAQLSIKILRVCAVVHLSDSGKGFIEHHPFLSQTLRRSLRTKCTSDTSYPCCSLLLSSTTLKSSNNSDFSANG